MTWLYGAAPSREQKPGLLGQELEHVTKRSREGTPRHRDLLLEVS